MPAAMLFPVFPIRVSRVIRGQIHPLGTAMSRRPARPLATQNSWDETSQPWSLALTRRAGIARIFLLP